MSHTNYQRQKVYSRDSRDSRGQHVFDFAPGATVSTQQAANMLGTSDDTIRRMCESGELKYYVLRPERSNSPWRVFKDEVLRHMDKVINRFDLGAPSVPQLRQGRQVPHEK